MQIHTNMHHKRHSRSRGFTLPEVFIASILSGLTLGFLIYVTIVSAKVISIVSMQSSYQQNAALAMEKIANFVRNAKLPFPGGQSQTELRFVNVLTPTIISSISLNTENSTLEYDPDVSTTSAPKVVIAKYIKSVSFEFLEQNTVVQVTLNFKYPKLKGFFRKLAPDDFLDATFMTRLFARNT
jgi:Tfp pilus assembly protein PilW